MAAMNSTVQAVVERINALAAERTTLYRQALDGWRPEQRARLKEIDAELATLWDERRRELAGHDDIVPVRHAA